VFWVNVNGLGAALLGSGGEHMEGVIRPFRGYAWGFHKGLDSWIKDVQRLSLVSHLSFVRRFLDVSVCWFEGFRHT
jgi:hypothetical protein